MDNHLALTLQALASSGFLIPCEQRAALDLSLAIKQQEARVSCLSFWGRIFTASGKDYLLSQGCNGISRLPDGTVRVDARRYYSQDGVKWMDLQALSEETYEACKTIRGCFNGEPSHTYSVILPRPPVQKNEGEHPQSRVQTQQLEENPDVKEERSNGGDEEVEIRQDDDEDDEDKPTREIKPSDAGASRTLHIGELDRLSALMQQVDYDCGVIPSGALINNAKKELVRNLYFPGSWSLELREFGAGVILRNLWWPGYSFYYKNSTKEFGSMYFGIGEKNIDLPFML